MRRAGATAVALAASVALVGCGTEATTTGPPNTDPNADHNAAPLAARDDLGHPLDNSRWIPDRVTIDGTQHARPAGVRARVVLLPDPSLSGADARNSSGCNTFDAETSLHGDTLRVVRGATTEKGCAPEVMDFEQALYAVFDGDLAFELHEADPAAREPATLTLTNDAGDTIHLTEIPGDPVFGDGPKAAAYLADSRWIIDWLFIDSANHPRPDEVTDADAYLELRPGHGEEDFQPSDAKAGCNHIQLESTLHGDTLRVRAHTVTDMACPGLVGLFELDFLDVFDGDLSFKIRDEDGPGDNRPARLLLTNAEHDSISLTEDLAG